jgi:hypothetical protein
MLHRKLFRTIEPPAVISVAPGTTALIVDA